jgi:hypothetical protein
MSSRDVSYHFEGGGGGGVFLPKKFKNKPQKIPLVPIKFPSNYFCFHQNP